MGCAILTRMEMRVAAIVPAYNEAPRIGPVLETLTSYPGFVEVVVVDDGSDDGTSEEAARYSVRVIRNASNKGKGAAMEVGARAVRADIFFFCDADIIGLSHTIIREVVEPVVRGEKEMFVAVRKTKVRRLGFGFSYTPLLDGQRAVTRSLWERVPARFKKQFQIEPALNYFAGVSSKGFGYRVYGEISQIVKEEKRGWLRGMLARLEMYRQIVWTQARLYA